MIFLKTKLSRVNEMKDLALKLAPSFIKLHKIALLRFLFPIKNKNVAYTYTFKYQYIVNHHWEYTGLKPVIVLLLAELNHLQLFIIKLFNLKTLTTNLYKFLSMNSDPILFSSIKILYVLNVTINYLSINKYFLK